MFLELIGYILFMVFFIKLFVSIFKRKNNKEYFKNNVVVRSESEVKKVYQDIEKDELATFQTEDIDAFKEHLYKIFYDFEVAYNNLDYNAMKLLSTKQLFQNYYTGITLDLEKGNKRIIKDIERNNMVVFETISTTVKQAISAQIEINYINYTQNKNGNIVSGNACKKITEKFEVIFRKDFGKDEPINCPNCGAPASSNKCEFCKTVLHDVDFKISSIKKVVESK